MTSLPPNATANTADFEFASLNEARNYRDALIEEFGPSLTGEVIEIGAGIGQITAHLRALPQIKRLLSIEPDPGFAARFRETYPEAEFIQGTIEQLPEGSASDAILSINVLEHIRDDEAELARYARILAPRNGRLCLFVPACPEIYSPIDKDFGHFRRYTREELGAKLHTAGFEIEQLYYYNFAGYFAWWLNFCLLKKRTFELDKVRFFDQYIFPVVHGLETGVMRPFFGQSVLAVAQAG